MKNKDINNTNKKMENSKAITIFNFECKSCHTKIGQLISNNIDENRVVCPRCGSGDVTYGTLLK